MKNLKRNILIASCTALFGGMYVSADGLPAVPTTPAAVNDVLFVKHFTVKEGYFHFWRKDQPVVHEGTLLVLSVDPDLVYPRNVAEPVLFVGNQTAERFNHGATSGMVVAIVPGHVDLQATPVWFGTPQLPDQVTSEIIKSERTLADNAGIQPLNITKISAAEKIGGTPLALGNLADLKVEAAKLVIKYAPEDRSFVEVFLTGGS
jgi:hypothetical protein